MKIQLEIPEATRLQLWLLIKEIYPERIIENRDYANPEIYSSALTGLAWGIEESKQSRLVGSALIPFSNFTQLELEPFRHARGDDSTPVGVRIPKRPSGNAGGAAVTPVTELVPMN